MKKCDKNIRGILKQRMRRKTTIGIGMTVICLFVLSFLPLIFNNRSNINTVLTSLAIILASTVFISVVMFVVLLFLRRPIKKAIKEYNENVENITSDIKESVERYSKYLSALCNTKRGYSVLEYSKNCEDKYTRAIRIRKKHQEDIRKKRAELAESYSDFISYGISEDEETIMPYNYDFDRQTEYAYPLEYPLGTAHQIEFLKLGNFAVSPTDFVKKITLTMEEIYDS